MWKLRKKPRRGERWRGCEGKIPADEPRRLWWNKGNPIVMAVNGGNNGTEKGAALQQYQNPPPGVDRPKGLAHGSTLIITLEEQMSHMPPLSLFRIRGGTRVSPVAPRCKTGNNFEPQ